MKKIMHVDNLPENIQKLLATAHEASQKAYAPFSNFHVGAAIEVKDGSIYSGQNQENAAYPSCMCAERVALYHRCARSESEITAVAVYAKNNTDVEQHSAAPCGECRQVILEYQSRQKHIFPVYSMNQNGYVTLWSSINELLPEGFHGKML